MSEPDKPHILGGTAIKPKERHGWERIRYILHNPETGTILSRTPKSWALITIFYLIYYTFLAAFWSLMMFVFWQTLDMATPKWIAEQSIIGTSPGLGLRPEQTDALIDSSMIFFNKDQREDSGNVAGWGGWSDRLEAFLGTYTNKGKQCSETDKVESGSGEACHFNLAALGPCNTKGHGYDIAQPCIFLKLNRIYGVSNDPYNDPEDLPEEMPANLKEHIKSRSTRIKSGSTAAANTQPTKRAWATWLTTLPLAASLPTISPSRTRSITRVLWWQSNLRTRISVSCCTSSAGLGPRTSTTTSERAWASATSSCSWWTTPWPKTWRRHREQTFESVFKSIFLPFLLCPSRPSII